MLPRASVPRVVPKTVVPMALVCRDQSSIYCWTTSNRSSRTAVVARTMRGPTYTQCFGEGCRIGTTKRFAGTQSRLMPSKGEAATQRCKLQHSISLSPLSVNLHYQLVHYSWIRAKQVTRCLPHLGPSLRLQFVNRTCGSKHAGGEYR